MNIEILYGTETGNTQMLAEDLAADLVSEHDVTVRNMSETELSSLAADKFLVMICSTYGDGGLPASAQPFAASLRDRRPNLSGLRFAIFGLGDSQYADTFGAGSRHLEDILHELGARKIGEREVHDVSGLEPLEEHARRWLKCILESFCDA